MQVLEPTMAKGILASVDDDIDQFFCLGGLSHRRRTAFLRLCKEQPSKDGSELMRRMLDRIKRNRSTLTEAGEAARGKEMWRWEKQLTLGDDNTSLEVRIERAIAHLLDHDWVNQVPVASGLTKANDKRCSLDIVHRLGPSEFEFIELKALGPGSTPNETQTPLFAAMELLKYGLLFLYCKQNRELLFPNGIEGKPILKATRVHLEVLMTSNCYLHSEKQGPFHIGWLNRLLRDGLSELNEEQRRTEAKHAVQIEFSFKELPKSFEWSDADHQVLVSRLKASPDWNILRERMADAVEKRSLALLL